MVISPNADLASAGREFRLASGESQQSGVIWSAIFGGAVSAVAVTVLLVMLGSGVGLAAISPFGGHGPGPVTFRVSAGIWLIVTQWISSGLGGYLTGRLRTKWAGLHTHEVFFRDTANGFVTWAAATLITLGIASSGIGAIMGGGMHRPPPPPHGEAMGFAGGNLADPVTRMMRPSHPDAALPAPEQRDEAQQILATGVAGKMLPDDRSYLSALIVARTGVSMPEAYQRIDSAVLQEKQEADAARKAGAATLMFGALAMLVGAFVACVAAAIGGQQRDEHL
jgi:hypothetical protein